VNIFKILASGDGSINEPNVSAFLGYLVNPNADHGIGDRLLKRILDTLLKNNPTSTLKEFLINKARLRDLSINSKFEINVLLEQAFKSDDLKKPKQIVDIVILCFDKSYKKKESLAKVILSNTYRGDLRQIFLIENKIRNTSSREDQLKDQCRSTIDALVPLLGKSEDDIKKLISIIFISPQGNHSEKEYKQLEKETSIDIPKCHIYWSEGEGNENTIVSFFKRNYKRRSRWR
jgi:hypothetical protein